LKNIVCYSKASEVTIGLELHHDEVVLSVNDNGVGFDPKEVNAGIGLSNIHDRARACNGRAELQTARNSGCTWEITIPVA
jgi:two-component system, NarL family, sensor kinase